MALLVERPTTTPKVFEVDLPRSKSISNRVLILDFLEGGGSSISGISESNDTKIVREVLKNFSASEWNVQDAGTAMRFLTSLAVLKNEATIILGTNRMHERPIGHLVECLRAIGAEINYLNEPEFPPLQVKSGELKAANLSLPGHMSSQFISSLLMIAPKVPGGLTIHYPSDQVSSSYIEMTIELMRLFGIEIIHENNLLRIEEQRFHSTRYNIESDWSSASYWFNVALLFPGVTIKLIGLKLDSIQGDSKIADYYRVLGVEVKQKSNSVEILCNQPNLQSLEMNLSSTPDLTQTLVSLAVSLELNGEISGIEHLRFKETDRIEALSKEIKKCGYDLKKANEVFRINGSAKNSIDDVIFEVYEDHRMAMSLSLLSCKFGSVVLNTEESVVNKSYPNFFNDLRNFGFTIKQVEI